MTHNLFYDSCNIVDKEEEVVEYDTEEEPFIREDRSINWKFVGKQLVKSVLLLGGIIGFSKVL